LEKYTGTLYRLEVIYGYGASVDGRAKFTNSGDYSTKAEFINALNIFISPDEVRDYIKRVAL
jgi:hypothetical protein